MAKKPERVVRSGKSKQQLRSDLKYWKDKLKGMQAGHRAELTVKKVILEIEEEIKNA